MPSRLSIFCNPYRPRVWHNRRSAKPQEEVRVSHRGQRERVLVAESEVNLTKTYDAIVIGSGAAGGMAAHVLTSHGLQVLLLEAGKKLPIEKELRSMEWPYDNPYRGCSRPISTRSASTNTPSAILPMAPALKRPSISKAT